MRKGTIDTLCVTKYTQFEASVLRISSSAISFSNKLGLHSIKSYYACAMSILLSGSIFKLGSQIDANKGPTADHGIH